MLDVLVIGGGFFGVSIACYLKESRGLRHVRIVESESRLLSRASYNNQARVHNGYHYPRSFVTAYRSRVNLPKFVSDFPFAVDDSFTKLYAIARRGSKVNSRQFQRFCKEIGARIEPASQKHLEMFDRRLIEDVFAVEEFAFDASQLRSWAEEKLAELDIQLSLGQQALACTRADGQTLVDIGNSADGSAVETVRARYVFNCTYSGLNQVSGGLPCVSAALKHEIAEMGLVEVPSAIQQLGVTVMDGPFFSVMPFPARGLHTLSHVRYTPHLYWHDQPGINPYLRLESYAGVSRVDRMLRDATRYMPALEGTVHVDSLFDVKTVLLKNEGNDGRPILFEKSSALPGYYSVLGGKIDNIYDIIEKLNQEPIYVS